MILPPTTVRVNVRKLDISRGSDEIVEDDVAVESPIEIVLNGKPVVVLMATPSQIEELVVGFLLDEGVIHDINDILSVRVLGRTVDVEIRNARSMHSHLTEFGIILTSCGSSGFLKPDAKPMLPKVSSDLRVNARDVSKMVCELGRSSLQFMRTGAMHSAALFQDNLMKAFAEDVGRHNAIDKVIGSSMKQELNLENSVLVTTGRQPGDLILKAARVGIPISVSMRGPIHSGIVSAERTGLTLVCFARGTRMNVYTFPERVVFGLSK